ncbi:MAG TPA: response regulator transcription factor [Beijerinckiaceae bacterium]|nr:response regulator transcription factor [Beijerinckiaceae bacterium]
MTIATGQAQAAPAASAKPADDAAHLLLVDDDNRIRTLLSRYLSARGYRVTTAADAQAARLRLHALKFDLIVLDAMMPGESGFEFARALRRDSQVPILMLTARAETSDRVRGLEAGADDYLTKPFDPKELALRIASILRRAAPHAEPLAARPIAVRFGAFIFVLDRSELIERDEPVHLTDRERAMLRLLAQTPGEPVSREALAAGPGNERTVDVQINRLRRKIERDPAAPRFLQTARGAGYRLVVDR